MYVQMGEETDSAYQVVFRSYTGAFVNFYVDKASGTTRIEEYVPALDVKSDAGTINLYDYIDKNEQDKIMGACRHPCHHLRRLHNHLLHQQ